MTDDHPSLDEFAEHLSLDELAELDEGLLPPERTSVLRAHLHGCEQCRSLAEAITDTRSMLAGLPAEPMPDDVRARLDDALATQSADQDEPDPQPAVVTALPTPPPEDPDPAVDDSPATLRRDVIPAPGTVRRRFGRPTLAGGAVAAAVVLAVGAIVIGAVNHHNGNSSGSTASSPSVLQAPNGGLIAGSQPTQFLQTSTGRNYTQANLDTDVQGLIARTPAPVAAAPTSASAAPGAGAAAAGNPNATKPGSRLSENAKRVPTAAPTPVVQSPASTLDSQPVPKPLQALSTSRAKLLACAAVLTGSPNAVPLAVDFGRWTDQAGSTSYDRAPSLIWVFKSPDPSAVAVFVTGPDCTDGTFYSYRKVPLS